MYYLSAPAAAPIAPPPPPPFTIGRKTVAEIRTVFDKAHSYIPAKRMKKLNWDKVSCLQVFLRM